MGSGCWFGNRCVVNFCCGVVCVVVDCFVVCCGVVVECVVAVERFKVLVISALHFQR